MGALDRFGGPEAWDAECDRDRARYAAMVEGKTCLDCGKCVKADGFPCGFCTEDGEMRYADDRPGESGFECFEDAA